MKSTHHYRLAFKDYLKNKATAEDIATLNIRDRFDVEFPNEDVDATLYKALKENNLFRQYGSVLINENNADGSILVSLSTTKAGLTKESSLYPECGNEIEDIRFSSYKFGLIMRLQKSFIDDTNFDFMHYINTEFGKRFGTAEEDIALNGTGIEQPKGLLHTAYIGTTTSTLTYDSIIKLYFSVDAEYRKNAVFIMNDKTAYALRTLKDANGNYLWNTANDTILGKKVVISNHMNDDSKPVIFGDLSYFWMIIRRPLAVRILAEKYATTNEYGYIANERLDFKLIRSDAIKVLKLDSEEETAQ